MKNGKPSQNWEKRVPIQGRSAPRWPVLALAGLLAWTALVSGCKKNPSSRPPQPVAANPVPPSPPPPPPPSPTPSLVEVADKRFDSGLYEEAAAAYEKALESDAESVGPEALFRLAVSYALGDKSGAQMDRVAELLRQAAEADAGGPLAGAARLILALLEENRALEDQSSQKDRRIKQLSEELERLKKIDLRRRPPER